MGRTTKNDDVILARSHRISGVSSNWTTWRRCVLVVDQPPFRLYHLHHAFAAKNAAATRGRLSQPPFSWFLVNVTLIKQSNQSTGDTVTVCIASALTIFPTTCTMTPRCSIPLFLLSLCLSSLAYPGEHSSWRSNVVRIWRRNTDTVDRNVPPEGYHNPLDAGGEMLTVRNVSAFPNAFSETVYVA